MRIAHTGLTVADLDAAIAVFTQVFGFSVERRGREPEPDLVARVAAIPGAAVEAAILSLGDERIELLCYGGPIDRGTATGRPCDAGAMHLALMCEDMDAVIAAAAGHGFVRVAPPVTLAAGPHRGRRIVYLRGLDGIIVELMQD